jgi:hypothetical protein
MTSPSTFEYQRVRLSTTAMAQRSETVQTWLENISIETARNKPTFRTYMLCQSSGKIILALHPIPLEFLQGLTHGERIELTKKMLFDMRSIKAKTPQATVAFALEESIKWMCPLITKKATSNATNSERSATSQTTAMKDTLSSSGKETGANSSSTTITTVPSMTSQTGARQIEERRGLGAPDASSTVTPNAWKYRQETFLRLAKIEAHPYHMFQYMASDHKVKQHRKAAASHRPPRHVSFNPTVEYKEYDEDSPPSISKAAIMAKAPCDGARTIQSIPTPRVISTLYTGPANLKPTSGDLLNQCIDAIISQGQCGIDELADQVVYLQSSLPHGDLAYQSVWVIDALSAICSAHDAIHDVRESKVQDWRLVKTAIEATERAHTLHESALLRVNNPLYRSCNGGADGCW